MKRISMLKISGFWFIFLLLFTIHYSLFTSPASAWSWGQPLVPCGTGGAECTRCDIFVLIKNLMDFGLLAIVPVGGTILIIIAGIFYILGAGNPGLLSRGKNIFTNTLYAIIIIGLAWLVANTILNALGSNNSGNWYSFTCTDAVVPVYSVPPPTSPTPTPSGSVSPTPTTSGVTCPFSGTNLCQGQSTACSNASCSQYTSSINQYAGAYASIMKSIMINESSCNISAQSGVGACGLMQLLPSTANIFRSQCGVATPVTCGWLQNPVNAGASICIAAKYVQSLASGACGSEPENIAAGYNGGSTACNPSASCQGETSCNNGPTRKWECLYDNTQHTVCNTGYDETKNYARKVNYCTQNPGF